MDCGIPFCHHACPVANLIPEWNDLARRDDWQDAIERLHSTNNFPEFTGKLCPAPVRGLLRAEPAGVAGHDQADRVGDHRPRLRRGLGAAADAGAAHRQEGRRRRLRARPAWPPPSSSPAPGTTSPSTSGPTASAACSATASPSSRWRRPCSTGGWTRCAPRAPGSSPASRSAAAGTATCPTEQLRAEYDAVVLAGGATVGRDLPAPGRELAGIHLAMEYLPYGNLQALGELDDPPINAHGKHVVIIGGGDTGADCLGTAHRQGAASVTQLEIMPAPPDRRAQDANPWPTYPMIMRVSSAHEEGGERLYSVNTERFLGDDARQRPGAAAARGGAGRRPVPEGRGHRARAAGRPGLPGHGLHRRAARGPGRRPRCRGRRPRQRRPRRASSCPPCPASSWPATSAAASR